MFPLSTHDLLTAWELGQSRSSVGRALALLCAACPGTTPEALGELSIGERDTRLLRLRELIFGCSLSGLADCPGCGERLQLDVNAAQLNLSPPENCELSVDAGGYHVEFRLPNSADLTAIRAATDVAAARRKLLERCITNGVAAADLHENVIEKVAAAMAHADPRGDVRLALNCPACGQTWDEIFDIAAFLWSEVHGWALRTLRGVHQLAATYGWSEADILAMNPRRRTAYLELIGG